MASFELPDMPQPRVSPTMLVGAASPLWGYFAAAAAGGVAYWWMTRLTRPVNLEALFAGQALLPEADPQIEAAPTVEAAPEAVAPEVIAEPPPIAEAVAPEPTVEAAPEPVVAPLPEPAPIETLDEAAARPRARKIAPTTEA